MPYDNTLYHTWDWNPSATQDEEEQLLGYQGLLRATDGMGDWLGGIDFWHWRMAGNAGSRYGVTPGSMVGQDLEDYLDLNV